MDAAAIEAAAASLQRTLIARYRTPAAGIVRVVICRSAIDGSHPPSTILLFRTVITDAAGRQLERSHAAIELHLSRAFGCGDVREAFDDLERIAAGAARDVAAARAAEITIEHRRQLERTADRERRLLERWQRRQPLIQPGLFDARRSLAADDEHHASSKMPRELMSHSVAARATAAAVAADPVLALVVLTINRN